MSFEDELLTLLNKYSRENGWNTPDHVLADYLKESLAAFDKAVGRRDYWWGFDSNKASTGSTESPRSTKSSADILGEFTEFADKVTTFVKSISDLIEKPNQSGKKP
jgi:hypothetical protein